MHNQPGFNAPLATSGPTIYPSLEEGFLFTLLTLREVEMMRAMNEITDKPDWETKAGHLPSTFCFAWYLRFDVAFGQ